MLEFLIPAIIFTGFLVGLILARISPEEMAPGEKYFIWALRISGLAIAIALLYFAGFGIVPFLIGLVFGFLIRQYHFALGCAIAGSVALSDMVLLLIGSLSFVFEIIYGTLTNAFRNPTRGKVFFKIILFFIPFLILLMSVAPKDLAIFSSGMFLAVLLIKSMPHTMNKY